MLTIKEHYKECLEGKSVKELKIYSLDLRLEMNQLKYDIERSNNANFRSPKNKKLSRINKNRLYLRETFKAIDKLGGIIKPTEEDIKAFEFQEKIPYIEKIYYSRSGYLGGFDIYETILKNEQVRVSHKETVDDGLTLYEIYPLTYHAVIEENIMSKQEFLKTIKRLRMGEWKNVYLSDDYGIRILDGESWGVEVHYSNSLSIFRCGGTNAFPYNFYDFNRLIEKAYEAYR